MQVGGHSALKEVTPDIQEIIDKLKPTIQDKTGKTYTTFQGVGYTTQVVNGLNYKFKVKVGDDDYVHVSAHRAPSSEAEATLQGVEEGKGSCCGL